MTWTTAKIALERYNIHASETAWIGTEFDAVIDNNETMDHLYRQVNDLVQDLPVSR
jgi:dephospho-CoA kinase